MKTKCAACGVEFDKPNGEFNRSERMRRRHYCSLRCTGKDNVKHLTPPKGVYPKNFALNPGTKKDEYSPFRHYLHSVRTHTAKNGKVVNVTLEDVKKQWDKQQGICPLTGWELDHSLCGSHSPRQPSLDRKDSSKGYIRGNIRFVALIAQYAKNKFDDSTVIQFAKAVVKQHKAA